LSHGPTVKAYVAPQIALAGFWKNKNIRNKTEKGKKWREKKFKRRGKRRSGLV